MMKQAIDTSSVIAHGAQMRIGAGELSTLEHWTRRLTGITLREHRREFLESRLARRVADTGAGTYADYIRILESDPAEHARFAEALTTHTTGFFRERTQYDWLRQTGLKALAEGVPRARELVIWSAACSTGQEAYSALMTAEQARPEMPSSFAVRVVGTDISRPVLKVAAEAVYDRAQIKDIPEALRHRFLLSSRNDDGVYRIVPELRRRTTWRQANLVSNTGIGDLKADIAFLRNVLIYFDEQQRNQVVENVVARLRPGGFLLVGHTEGCHARRPDLEAVRPSIFRKIQK
jgi:chemotaxis protein methyltransferase CheR